MKSVTNQMNEEQGKVVKVGFDQLQNPTPTGAKIFFRAFLYVSALWALAAPSITELPPHTLETINKYLLLANGIINMTIQFWGWDFPTTKNNFYNKKP